MTRLVPRFVFSALAAGTMSATLAAQAQPTAAQRATILAVADSALAAINRGDMDAFTNLMTPEAQTIVVRAGDTARVTVRTREEWRSRPSTSRVTERGFRGEVHVSGPLAVVWLPYDLYVNGAWSHCGVDMFTLVHAAGAWKIASLSYTIEQPPACEKHPAGPPRG